MNIILTTDIQFETDPTQKNTCLPFDILKAETPEGENYFFVIKSDATANLPIDGIPSEAVIGWVIVPPGTDEPDLPSLFNPNGRFVHFIHRVIAEHAPRIHDLIEAASVQPDGWLVIADKRTVYDPGTTPQVEDVIGVFKVFNGVILAESYARNPDHKILNKVGDFVQLGEALQACLLEELARLVTPKVYH
jgi:hypothetical protein